MASSGIRKAALLLTSLDARTAGELLKSAQPEVITEIAAELASLDLSGGDQDDEAGTSTESAREFLTLLKQSSGEFGGSYSLNRLLEIALGEEKSKETRKRVDQMVRSRDPFSEVRIVDAERLVMALQGEPPQVAAIVLSELRSQSAREVLSLLDDHFRAEAVRAMTSKELATPEARLRVAAVIRNRLEEQQDKQQDQAILAQQKEKLHKQRLRKIAVIMQGLNTELCESLLKELAEADPETIQTLRSLMVIWDDISRIDDKSLREALRTADAQVLALALYEADLMIVQKIRENISQRAGEMIDEEQSLLSSPKEEKILEAREGILEVLRDMSAKGELVLESK